MHDVEGQLKSYWETIVGDLSLPEAAAITAAQAPEVDPVPNDLVPSTNGRREIPVQPGAVAPSRSHQRSLWIGALAAAVVLVVSGIGVASQFVTPTETEADQGSSTTLDLGSSTTLDQVTTTASNEPATSDADVTPTSIPTDATPPPLGAIPRVEPLDAINGHNGVAPTVATPLPDVANAILESGAAGRLPLGVVTSLPPWTQLDFLSEFCEETCARDARFVPHAESMEGHPFFIAHGFPNDGPEPLPAEFDLAVYSFPMDQPSEFGGVAIGPTIRYVSDYVIRTDASRCGPMYGTQADPTSCEWFIHEFSDGLPGGRHALWAVWEAPCAAWAEMGLVSGCADPAEVLSHFSSGVDSSFGESVVQGDLEADPNREAEAQALAVPIEDRNLDSDFSGAAATGGTPLPDFDSAIAGDIAGPALGLGVRNELPGPIYLDFLSELCEGSTCFRDAVFKNDTAPGAGSGPFRSGSPFHVRHGFVNSGPEALGEGFDVVLYVFAMDDPGEIGGFSHGAPLRFHSDFVMRGETEACGPLYRSQSGPVTCEWFVHEFADGLPSGRFGMWAFWYAPCSAWVDMGYTDGCADPNAVMSLFSSGVDSPIE